MKLSGNMDTKLKMYEKGIQTDLEYYMIDPLKRCIFFSGFFFATGSLFFYTVFVAGTFGFAFGCCLC